MSSGVWRGDIAMARHRAACTGADRTSLYDDMANEIIAEL